jgi:parallel beta-helix repeat protein
MSTNGGKTLYVGGTGEGNYTKIQDAIDNASDWDTVFVYNGTYFENVEINKNISLIGEDKDITIIDGYRNGNAVNITNEYVTIKGFTIQKSKYLFAGIELGSHYNTILNNNINNNTYGILCDNSYHNTIQFNNLDYNDFFGIKLGWGRYNNISYNNITKNERGIRLMDNSEFNVISNNFISRTENSGISFWDSSYNTISDNIFYKNGQGIYLYHSSGNIIFKNNITYCWSFGFHIIARDNIIYHNNFISNNPNTDDVGEFNQYNNNNRETGNYWDDYEEKYPDAKPLSQRPWIWDTPYEIPGGDNKDMYPLVNQYPNSLSRTMPKNRATYNSLFLKLLEQFPILQKILLFYLIK